MSKAQPLQQPGTDPAQPSTATRSYTDFRPSPKLQVPRPAGAPPAPSPPSPPPQGRLPLLLNKGNIIPSLQLNKSISHINTIKCRFWGRELG